MTPWTIAYQVSLSMGFSRQGYWRSLPFLTPGDRSGVSCVSSTEPPGKPTGKHACARSVAQPRLILCNPTDCSLPASSVHGIFQARILEGVAISFSRIFPTQGSNPCLLHWQGDSSPLNHLGGPTSIILYTDYTSNEKKLFLILKLKNK